MPEFTIKVSRDDIDQGEDGEPEFCAIALAAMRCIPGAFWVQVDLPTVLVWLGPGGETHAAGLLPPEARDFAERFDGYGADDEPSGKDVEPIEFLLSLEPASPLED